jgi:hypothetical protein
VDWAEAIMTRMSRMRTASGWAGAAAEGVEGIAQFHELAARHADEPAGVVIETDRACSLPR